MLNTLFGPQRRANSNDGGWWGPYGGFWSQRVRTQSGATVDEEIARTYSAVWCASRVLVESGCVLPLSLHERVSHDDRKLAIDHPSFNAIKNRPNPDMTPMPFREGRMDHQINWGNGFGEVERNRYGQVANLWPIHPARVRPVRPWDGAAYEQGYKYWIRNNDSSWMPMFADEMLHIPGALSQDGIWGKGVIQHARESIGFGIATERHGANFFGSGGTPRIVIKNMPGLKDREARQNFRSEWKQIHGSPDSGEVAILPVGADLTPLEISNEAMQFLETRKHNVAEIARWYKVPVYMLEEYEKAASYASVEMRSLEFVIYSLLPWLRRWEEQCNLKLLSEEERSQFYFEHNLAGLLRGDLKTRMEAYEVGLRTGILTLNMINRLENWPNIGPEGDERFIMMNMSTVARIVNGENLKSASAPTGGALPAPSEEDEDDTSEGDVIDLPDIRQTDSYSCGAACAMSVGLYFGVGPTDLEEWKKLLDTTPQNSTKPSKIIEVLGELGLVVTAAHNMTVDDLKACWKAGRPVITPIQEYGLPSKQASFDYGHYCAVIGIFGNKKRYVMVQDPSIDTVLEGQDADQAPGRMPIDEEKWLEVWHDKDADGNEFIQYGIIVGETVGDGDADEDDDEDDEEGLGDREQGSELEPSTQPDDDTDVPASSSQSGIANGGISSNDGEGRTLIAARRVFVDALTRMYTKEANAINRLNGRADRLEKAQDFYTKHAATLTEALKPAAAVFAAAGKSFDVSQVSQRLIDKSLSWLTVEQDINVNYLSRPAAELAAIVADQILGVPASGTP